MKIDEYEEQIEDVDMRITALIAERSLLVKELALIKKNTNQTSSRKKSYLEICMEMSRRLKLDLVNMRQIYLHLLQMEFELEKKL